MADKPVDFESETQQTLSQLRQKAERDKYLDRIEGELNAIEQKIRDDKQADLQAFKKEIKELIGDEIVMRYHYIQGVARHNSYLDPEILEAIKVLQDPPDHHVAGHPTQIIPRKSNYEAMSMSRHMPYSES